MKVLKKAAVAAMVAVIGFSAIPTNTVQAEVTITVTTNKGKVTTTKKETTTKSTTTKAKTTTVDAYVLSRSKTKASFITTDGTKFTMPVVLNASDKGDLVKVTFQGTLEKASKIRISNQEKAKTIVGKIDHETTGMSVLQIISKGKSYSFLKDYCEMKVSGSTKDNVKVYYIDQTAVLVEAAE